MNGEFGGIKRPRYLVRVYRTWKELQTALNLAWEHGYTRDEMRREENGGAWYYLVIWKQVGATNGQEAKPDARNEIAEYCRRQEERREQDRRARGLEARESEESAT